MNIDTQDKLQVTSSFGGFSQTKKVLISGYRENSILCTVFENIKWSPETGQLTALLYIGSVHNLFERGHHFLTSVCSQNWAALFPTRIENNIVSHVTKFVVLDACILNKYLIMIYVIILVFKCLTGGCL